MLIEIVIFSVHGDNSYVEGRSKICKQNQGFKFYSSQATRLGIVQIFRHHSHINSGTVYVQ